MKANPDRSEASPEPKDRQAQAVSIKLKSVPSVPTVAKRKIKKVLNYYSASAKTFASLFTREFPRRKFINSKQFKIVVNTPKNPSIFS